METHFDVTSGQPLPQRDIGFRAYGLVVENITNQWYYEPSRRRFIPPYQAGVTIPLAGVSVAVLTPTAPGITTQQSPIGGEFLSASFLSDPVPAGGGINVGSFTAPPPVALTDFAQGAQPAAPGVGNTRVWADDQGELHRLLSNAADAQLVDTSVAGLVSTAMLAAHAATDFVGGANNLSGSTTSATAVPITGGSATLACAGGFVFGLLTLKIIPGGTTGLWYRVDGGAWAQFAGTPATGQVTGIFAPGVLAAGNHTIDVGFSTSAGTVSVDAAINGVYLLLELRR